ncbi:DUF5686 and carboxypeptidase-like regulatory domain-containing protein [Dysgonomonas sp. 25]|uniref:DUF5686 and carboxypeptidase-like regulatory domain-containing protein n=1 Tax=Dysgonomonas sp. 25 TaxID=2302933 RepID=UPI0013D7AD8B|nr:DUF5686 and carboxypeptidase-like regulatory domain-containing protein [Dysgonomonas sp. 25]NDV69595.1 carboxypeptidase-like regulatory domain-containing protein [Dysgonomonas sp. 25]
MNKSIGYNSLLKSTCALLLLLLFITTNAFSQNTTTIKGVVKDSVTQELLPYVTIKFAGTTIGDYSGEDGTFRISNNQNKTEVIVSFLGYKSAKFTIPAGKTTTKEVLLVTEDKTLNEVVIRPTKEKYSKKNNPAVELIQNVIKYKKKNGFQAEEYYQCKEYERILFALNEFKPDKAQFKKFKFLPNYMVTSEIDNKPILPFSVRETISDYYYRKDPKTERRIVQAYDQAGIDKAMELEGLDVVINEVFKDVNVYDNSITLLFQEFVSPLSEHRAVSFFKWYITDTVTVDDKKYTRLDFVPFNTRDIGFIGNMLVTTDSTYAVKKVTLRVPTKSNINFVDEMVVQQDFQKAEDGKWIPEKQQMSIDLSLYQQIKIYVDKTREFSDFVYNEPQDSIYSIKAPITFVEDFNDKDKTFWDENRPADQHVDYRMDELMDELTNIGFLKFFINFGKFMGSGGYIRTNKDPEKNKVDLGTAFTAYSYNSVEGNRLRLTARTTPNFNKHLFLYGYAAYGTKDGRPKYYGEATWSFKEQKKNKDEFPKNNLVVGYKYDMNSLGQRFTQNERDNIFGSISSTKNEKFTYNRQTLVSWEREFYNGFSFALKGQTFDERPAGKLKFERLDDLNNIIPENSIRTTEATLSLRYAPNEKFYQHHRTRYDVPSPGYSVILSHTNGLKGVLGGQYDYYKSSLMFEGRLWVAQFGKITTNIQAEKVWGEVPFPLLLSPNANSSYLLQKGDFYLVEPLEFLHDKQITWDVEWQMGGYIFNRIPLINRLKLREVFGLRGAWGDLDERNDPTKNHDLLIFPNAAFKADNKPYMEYTVGVENILSFIRIDYVRRINYRNHPDINKSGVRFSLKFTF